jgi:hypothetical protein
LGASISNAHAEQTLDPICIDSVDGPPQLSPVSTVCSSSKDQPQLSQSVWKGDVYDLESSDDDVPLQPRIPGNERPASVPPVSSATRVDDAQAPPNLPSEDINAAEPPRRALRARRPEQQMPYTLDLIRHRDQFRRRGLKPVHNPGEASHAKENDDQYQADEDNSENEPEPQFQSPPGAEEHLPKRRKIRQDNNDDEAQPEIHLRPGRRKFLDPRQFDVSRKVEPPRQDTPEREVVFTCYYGLTSRCLTLISCLTRTLDFFPSLQRLISETLLVQGHLLPSGDSLQLVIQRRSLLPVSRFQ